MFLRLFRSPNKILCVARGLGRGPLTAVNQMHQQRHLCHIGSRRMKWQIKFLKSLSSLRQRYCLWRLRRLLGVDFDEGGFLVGSRQAAATMIEAVRRSDWPCIRGCCTERGSADIYGLSRDQSSYNNLVRFQSEHLRHALPMRVVRQWIDGRRYVLVDMLFVGLRNLYDFPSIEEMEEMETQIQAVIPESEPHELEPLACRLVVAELVLTFCKELECEDTYEYYMELDSINNPDNPEAGWLVDAYRMHRFKVVSFSPATYNIRVREFPKPV
ncbi:uncharacterized protein [Drosophila bipectinata]|uniref:uncharacterized protein n=1 Tax=Drosophila bipectinata TaxID=42026 RepID=UPI001C8A63C8|nr:uncharacterized protein LOC108125175 [Drosophila bipectinata]